MFLEDGMVKAKVKEVLEVGETIKDGTRTKDGNNHNKVVVVGDNNLNNNGVKEVGTNNNKGAGTNNSLVTIGTKVTHNNNNGVNNINNGV